MKKIKKILICLILCVLSLIGAGACKSADVSIVIMDAIDQKELLLNREFDATDVVENYNEKYSYEIKECFYLDNLDDLKRYEIPVTDKTKFTQTVPFDVHIVLEAKYKDSTAKEEFVLKLIIPENALQEHFRLAWNDTGVSKQIVANKEFLYGDEETAVKVSYLGEDNYDKSNGVTIGSFICDSEENTLTSWDNPVVTCQIYNPQNYDLQIAYMATKSKKLYNNLGHMYDAITLKAGQWTQVNWSLRKAGLNWNFLADDIAISFKVRIVDATGLQSPYNYQLYFCSMDIADYTVERFPNLETRTDDEIWEQMDGELTDKYLSTYLIQDTTTISRFAMTSTNAEVIDYTNSSITAPINVSSSYVKYSVVPTAQVASGNYYSLPVCFSTNSNRVALSDDYKALLSADDWEDVDSLSFEFWVYNDSDEPLTFYLSTEDDRTYWNGAKTIRISQSRIWTKVTVSLAKDYGYTTSPFSEESYDVCLFAKYQRPTEDVDWSSFVGTFYIDGFDFFNEEVVDIGDETSKLLSSSVGGSNVHKFYGVDFTTSVVASSDVGIEMPDGDDGWLVKYDAIKNEEKFTSALNDSSSMMGNIIRLPQAKLLELEENIEVLKNGYIGFWIYTDIVNSGNPTLSIACFAGTHETAATYFTKTISDGKWSYVEFALKDFSDFLTVDGDTVTIKTLNIVIRYSSDSVKDAFNETLYIAGFDIYKTSRMQEKTIAELLSNKTVAASSAENWYTLGATGSVVDSTLVATPDGKGYNWLAQFSVKYTRDKNIAKGWGAIAQLKQEDVLIINDDVDTLKDGYVGFYVYTALTDTDFDKVQVEVYSGAFGRSGAKATQVLTSGEWTYVEFALSDFVTDNGDGTVTIKDLCIAVYYNPTTAEYTKTTFDEQTLYIAGFDIYKDSKQG